MMYNTYIDVVSHLNRHPAMYVSPNHPNPPRAADTPEDRGQLLGSWPRGRDSELRLSLESYQGNNYLSLRVWTRDEAGRMWPTRKGTSIRMGEAADVAAAILEASRGAGEPAPSNGHQTGGYRPQAAPRGRQRPSPGHPPIP